MDLIAAEPFQLVCVERLAECLLADQGPVRNRGYPGSMPRCRETPSFIDRLGSEASVTIFPVALPFRRSTAGRAAMHPATGLTGDRWRLAWLPAPRLR